MILDKIIEAKKIEVDILKKEKPLESFIDTIEIKPTFFYDKLAMEGISIIAEVKKASPSKGIIKEDFNPIEIAKEYEQNNAAAISVLTEKDFFKGSTEYLLNISKIVKTPLLRKDFIFDEYQIYEAKKNGASAVLLIGEILNYNQILDFYGICQKLKLDILIEVHSLEVLKKVLDTPCRIIGVNNRNLNTFEVDIKTTLRLKEYITGERLTVAESGINKRADVEMLERNGVNAILVGESLMRAESISLKIKELLGR